MTKIEVAQKNAIVGDSFAEEKVECDRVAGAVVRVEDFDPVAADQVEG